MTATCKTRELVAVTGNFATTAWVVELVALTGNFATTAWVVEVMTVIAVKTM